MTVKSTAVALRCPRCNELHDSGEPHVCGGSSSPQVAVNFPGRSHDPLVGAVIGERYAIIERLSAGGMGVVYMAKHVLLDSLVAVKILLKPQDPDAQYRFLQEAQLASKIQHANTVYISDFGVLPDGRSYIVMEFLRGPTLSEVISRGPVPPARVCQIGLQIARGLQAVHDKGIIHRDLKPDNIFLIEQDGQKDFVKIVDFGIATATGGPTINIRLGEGIDPNSSEAQRALKERHTLPGTVLGTPHYMSPEQALGDDVDARADQYALGCILYEMLTGTVPFEDDNAAALMFKHAYRPPPELRKRLPSLVISEQLEKIVARTLAKKRNDRFAAMRDLEQVLVNELEELGGKSDPGRRSATNLSPVDPNRLNTVTGVMPTQRRRPVLALGIITLALVAALGGALLTYLHFVRKPGERDRIDTKQLLALREDAIAQLKQDLQHPDPELRQGAASALAATYAPGLTPLLTALLDDKAVSVRLRTAEALGQLGQQSVVPQLAAQLATVSTQPIVAEAAAEALDQLGDARGQQALRAALNGKYDPARLRAALYLCGRGDREAQKVLTTAVQRGKVPEEGAIILLLRLAQTGDTAARDNLLTRLSTMQNREMQLNLASSLGRIGEPRGRDFLREQARKPGQLQLRAAALLAALDEPVEPEQFRSVLGNPDAAGPMRLLALSGLSYVGVSADLRRMHPLLKDATEPRVRQGAAVAMVRLSDADPTLAAAQSLGWAQEVTSNPNWLLRDQAVAALGDLEGRDSTVALGRILGRRDADPTVRREAAQALGRRRDPEALRLLHDGLTDSDPGVRQEVLRSIGAVAKRLTERGQRTARDEASIWLNKAASQGSPSEQLAARSSMLLLGDEGQRGPLLGILKTGDEPTRRQVVEQVDRDREVLAAALGDSTPGVRRLAARKLAALGDKRASSVLREAAAERPVTTETLRSYAALRRLGEEMEPPPESAGMLNSPEPAVREAALEAAVAQGPDVARPALERSTRDPDRSVRLKVIELADKLAQTLDGPPTLSIAVLKRLARDTDTAVRARASALLTRLLPSAQPQPAEAPTPAPTPTPTAPATPTPPPPASVDAGAARTEASTTPPETETTPPTQPEVDPAGPGSKFKSASMPVDKQGRVDVAAMLRAGSEPFKNKDYRKAQKALERLSSLCGRESAKVCAPIAYDLAYYLGRSYEAQGQFAEAMNEFQRLEGQRGGNSAERSYLGDAVPRLGKKLGRVQVQRLRKGRCETTIMWVTPGEQEIRISAKEKRTVKVGPNQKTTVGACK